MQDASTGLLIDQFVSGDKQSFQVLISHVERRLYYTARKTLSGILRGAPGICETDFVLQELTLKLLREIESFSDDLRLKPPKDREKHFYIFTSRKIRDVIIKEIRTSRVRRLKSKRSEGAFHVGNESERGDFIASVPMGESNSPEQIAMLAERNEKLAAFYGDFCEFVNELPDELQSVTDLHWFQNFTHAQVGEILGIAAITSRKRWGKVRDLAKGRFPAIAFV